MTAKTPSGGFCHREDGSLVIFGLFLFVVMLMVGGMAVDLMRYETHRARLQSTLDRAVLAAASIEQPLDPVDVVEDYFDKANLSDFLDEVTFERDLTSREVTASASMSVNSLFMKLLGVDYLSAPAAGTAVESASRTEVSLVVDVSGSMGWSSSSGGSKISILRNAAREFVNILQCDPNDPDETVDCTVEPGTVSITLVPYSEQVVAGESVLDQLTVTEEQTESACVTFRASEFSDVAMDPDHEFKRTGHFDPWRSAYSTPSNWTCRTESWREIAPLEDDPADLRGAISSLSAGGYTSIDVGMKWGAAFLDPAFQPVITGLINAGEVSNYFDDRPYTYTENGIQKVIVLMTDGVNTTQHYLYDNYREGLSGVYRNNTYTNRWSIYRPSNDRYYWVQVGGSYWNQRNSWHDHPYGAGSEPGDPVELTFPELWERRTWRWYKQWWWLNNPGSSYGNSTKNARLDTICDAVKDQNIAIFTIGFEVTSASADVMRECASSPGHYFDVDGTDLTEAFAAIARQISALRLVN